MQRRFVLMLVILVVAGLATWMGTAGRRAQSSPRAEPPPESAPSTPPPATLVAPDVVPSPEVVVPEPQREDVAPMPASSVAASSATTCTLVVRVVAKQTAAPLARVRVWAMPDDAGPHSTDHVEGTRGTLEKAPVTADEGVVEIEVPPGFDLRVTATGEDDSAGNASAHVAPLEAGERREIVFELATGNDLHYFGRVLARQDRSPVSATVGVVRDRTTFRSIDNGPSERHSERTLLGDTTTDVRGLFELWLPSWREPDLWIHADGFAEVLLQIGPDHDTPDTAKEILLSRSATLLARIVDAGGSALPDAAVRLWTEAYNVAERDHGSVYLPSIHECEWTGAADPAGTCRVESVPPDVALHVEVWTGEELAKQDIPPLSLHPGEVREVEWRIGGGCRLTGTVVDQDGKPMAERTLWLQRAAQARPVFFEKYHSGEVVRETRTDSDGRFAFDDVEVGTSWLGPAAERDDDDAADPNALAAVGEVVEIPEGLSSKELELRVHRGLYIRGSVLTPTGEPAPDTYVFGGGEVASWGMQARTGDDGTFALGPLRPGRYSFSAHGGRKDANSEVVQANGGEEGIVLRLRSGGSLLGTVVDERTGAPCVAQIMCAPTDRGDRRMWMAESDESGFRIQGLPPGTYDLAANSSGKRTGVLRGVVVRAGNETGDLVVPLVAGGLVRVKFAGSSGYAQYRALSDDVPVGGDGIPAGGTSDAIVPAGKVVIRYWLPEAQGEELELAIEVAVGEEREVVIGAQ